MLRTLTRRDDRRRKAFTLLEVLAVVTIIAILAGLASVYVFRYIDQARKDAATTKARHLAQVLQIYYQQKNEYPASLDVLLQPGDGGKPFLGPEELVDPWGNRFQFDPAGPHNNTLRPDVWTQTPDGIQVGNW